MPPIKADVQVKLDHTCDEYKTPSTVIGTE